VQIAADPSPAVPAVSARGEDSHGSGLGTILKTGAVVWVAIWILSGITDPRPGEILRASLKPPKDYWKQR
jgi:hypothetical protein